MNISFESLQPMLTKDIFQKMKETDLRQKVLIPLLQAMEYQDVYEYHGGAGEQGKDIVCWKPDDLSSRKNLALVVKVTKMSGQAQVSKGTAGEVHTQISQCFGSSYIDPISGEDQEIHHVWVVSNKKITKEAVNAIKSALASTNLMRNVSFIDGNQLWKLVEKYLALSMWAFVEEVQKHVREADSHYEAQVTISGKETSIAIVEKFPGAAEEKPIIVSPKFIFPTAEDAKKFNASFHQHIETGDPFQVPSEFIGEVDLPDFVKTMLGIDDLRFHTLEFLPIPPEHKIPVQIRFSCDDGDNYTLNYVLLEITKSGTKKITLESIEVGTPVHIKFVLSYEQKLVNFRIQPRDIPLNATQYYDLLKLFTCISKNVRVEVISLEQEMLLFEQKIAMGGIVPPDPRFVALIDKLRTIQLKTKKPIIIPDREFASDELEFITELYQIVTGGRLENNWSEHSIDLDPQLGDVNNLITIFGNDKEGQLILEREETASLFDVEIPLGRVRYHLRTAKLKNVDDLIASHEGSKSANSGVKLLFAPGQDPTVVREYLEWVP